MPDPRFSGPGGNAGAREIYGIETNRILDACRDRDCFQDTPVMLTTIGKDLIANTNNVRVKNATITGTNITTDPVRFNRGFYTVDVKLYVTCECEACLPQGQTQEFEGVAVLDKRVVLFGGESNVSVFRSNRCGGFCSLPEPVTSTCGNPEAVVEVLEPIVLSAKVKEKKEHHCHCCCAADIPVEIADTVNGTLADDEDGRRFLAVSLGLFSVVRLVRPAQFLMQGSEYCLPEKECVAAAEEDPCATFQNMPFPAAQFCPNATSPAGNNRPSRCCGNS